MNDSKFKSVKISQTAVITLNGSIEKIFPLFGAFEERKWAEGWDPELIYPSEEIIEEGTTFKTKGHATDESEFLWRISKYQPQDFLIQYLVSTENRYWTITINCKPAGDNKTSAEVTYSFIGLNETGNKFNNEAIQRMYKHNLKDWEEEINRYLNV